MNELGNKSGKVAWFSATKGYGFINVEGEKDLFVHFSDLLMEGYKKLIEGQHVEFEIGVAENGKPKAVNVTVKL